MVSKLNPIFVNALLAFLCGLLVMWSSHAFPEMMRFFVDRTCKVLSYPEKPAEELHSLIQAGSNWVMERKSLQDRSRELEIENLNLRTTLHKAAIKPPQSTAALIGGRVTLRYPEAWWKEVRIDKGEKAGVRIGAPVLSDGYMIGRVTGVGPDYAWVELITSASFMLAAVVDEMWDLGVITGDDMGNIWLMYTPPEKEYQRGMSVSTALVGDYLPPGIPIGKVFGTGEPRDGFIPQKIVSGAHLTQLYNVQVLRAGAVPDGRAEHN